MQYTIQDYTHVDPNRAKGSVSVEIRDMGDIGCRLAIDARKDGQVRKSVFVHAERQPMAELGAILLAHGLLDEWPNVVSIVQQLAGQKFDRDQLEWINEGLSRLSAEFRVYLANTD